MSFFSPAAAGSRSGLGLILCIAWVSSACGESISISGKDNATAALVVAKALCAEAERCGVVEFGCLEGVIPLQCEAIFLDFDLQNCIDTLSQQTESRLDACTRTGEINSAVNDCVNGRVAASCPSDFDIQSYVLDLEMGLEPGFLGEPPPVACATMDDLLRTCP